MAKKTNTCGAEERTLLSYFKGSGRFALIGMAIAFLVSALPITYGGVLSKTTYEARRSVEFIFDGIEEKTYPSGLPFAIQDVISPVVLRRSFEQLDLAEYGIKYADFLNAIHIEPFAETYDDRAKAYRTRLDVEALEGPDIEIIEQQMREDLARLYNRTARLTLAMTEYGSLSAERLDQILVVVMENWARHAVEERGVLNLPGTMGEGELVAPEQLSTLSFPLIEEYLNAAVERASGRIGALSEIPGATTLTSAGQGASVSLSDLTSQLETVSNFQIIPLMHELLATGKAADWRTARFYFEQERLRIALTIRELAEGADNLEAANNSYIALDRSLRPSRGGIVDAQGSTDSLSGDFITVGDGFAERVFDIAETTDRHGFVQRNLTEKLEVQGEISALRNRLSRIEAFEAVAASSGNPSYSPNDLSQMQAIAAQMNGIWAQIGQIDERLRDQKNWQPGHLYNLIGEDESSNIFRPLWGTRNIALIIVLTIMGAMCGIVYSVMRRLSQA